MPSSGQTTGTRVVERSFSNFPKEDWTAASREGCLDAGQVQQLSAHSLWGSDRSGQGVRLGKSRVSRTEVPGCLGRQWWPIPWTGRTQVGVVWR